jgi:hypothetical protein
MATMRRTAVEHYSETGRWPVSWSAVWIGALAALALALIIGLVAISVGAYRVGPGGRLVISNGARVAGVMFSVCGAFFSFVVGGWIAGKIIGMRRSEPAMLHGVVAWLVAVPLLLLLAALGSGGFFGLWYGGLAGTPAWVQPVASVVDPKAIVAARHAALGAVSALLVGLVGAVIGGWMASGEPMNLTYHRTREALASGHAD